MNATTYLSTATYTCDEGYDLLGSSVVECNESGQWNDTANCRIKGLIPYCYENIFKRLE